MHDPEELFVISTISRKDIAGELNSIVEMEAAENGEQPVLIAENDPRLTREFCQEYADRMHSIDEDFPDEDKASSMHHELAEEMLEKLREQSIADAI